MHSYNQLNAKGNCPLSVFVWLYITDHTFEFLALTCRLKKSKETELGIKGRLKIRLLQIPSCLVKCLMAYFKFVAF
jgi:hypothetical protein